jgi:hypothetical protein
MGNEAEEIRTLDEYRAVAGLPVGVIVVTDTATGTKAHRPSCATISETTFSTKVLENKARNGRYYFFLRLADAERRLGAHPCRRCH